MRKFLFLVCLAIGLAVASSCNSCSNDAPWGIEYSLTSNGKTDGFVDVAFINGDFNIGGDANYEFSWSNAPKNLTLSDVKGIKPLAEALACKDAKTLQAAEYVNSWLDDSIKVVAFEGHYDVYVKGYVKETKTQITFSIDRHFSNIEDPEK